MNYLIKHLFSINLHLGSIKPLSENNIFILGLNNKYSIIDLNKTIISLHNSCSFINNLIINNGSVNILNNNHYNFNYLKHIFKNIKLVNITKNHINGLYSNNLDNTNHQCVIFYNTDNQLNTIIECHNQLIPIIGLVDTNELTNLIDFSVLGNNKSIKCLFFFSNILNSTISKGLDKQVCKIYK